MASLISLKRASASLFPGFTSGWCLRASLRNAALISFSVAVFGNAEDLVVVLVVHRSPAESSRVRYRDQSSAPRAGPLLHATLRQPEGRLRERRPALRHHPGQARVGAGEGWVQLDRPAKRGLDPLEALGAGRLSQQQVAVHVVRVVARAGERRRPGERLARLALPPLLPGEEAQGLVGRRLPGIEARATGRPGPGPRRRGPWPRGSRREPRATQRQAQGASGPGFLRHLHPSRPPSVGEDRPPHVRLELPVQGFHVAEGFPGSLRRGLPGLEQGRKAVDLAPALLGPQQEVVHERPGLRVEDRGPVLLGVLGRVAPHREEHGQGQ